MNTTDLGNGRLRVSSGAPWEERVGYCRALRVGAHIWVSGTVAVKDGQIAHPGDAYAQARVCFDIIGRALEAAGASLAHVVRTRMYLAALSDFDEVGRAHGEVFATVRPATSMLQVGGLVEGALVEIEAEAFAS